MKLGELKSNSKEAFDGSIIESMLDACSELTEEERAKVLESIKTIRPSEKTE